MIQDLEEARQSRVWLGQGGLRQRLTDDGLQVPPSFDPPAPSCQPMLIPSRVQWWWGLALKRRPQYLQIETGSSTVFS